MERKEEHLNRVVAHQAVCSWPPFFQIFTESVVGATDSSNLKKSRAERHSIRLRIHSQPQTWFVFTWLRFRFASGVLVTLFEAQRETVVSMAAWDSRKEEQENAPGWSESFFFLGDQWETVHPIFYTTSSFSSSIFKAGLFLLSWRPLRVFWALFKRRVDMPRIQIPSPSCPHLFFSTASF